MRRLALTRAAASFGFVMGSRYQICGWPRRPNIYGNVAQVHAIGQITLAYNNLESYLDLIFQACMPTEKSFSERLFHKLNNRDRIDLLLAVIRSSRFHPQAKDRLNHLLQCYAICTENRNILSHATSEEAYAGVFHLSKRSANDPAVTNRFKIPLADLRLVAEQIHEISEYMTQLLFWLMVRSGLPGSYKSSLLIPPLEKITRPNLRRVLQAVPEIATLPEKPPKPRRLIPSTPPIVRPNGKRPPLPRNPK
jgi:hypothetical protein